VGAGTTLGIDSFDTGKMDYPPGHDKLAAGWIDPNYQLNITVRDLEVFHAEAAKPCRMYFQRLFRRTRWPSSTTPRTRRLVGQPMP
jgi:hypothetical protein